jgi:membrane associated rhomboid family serine protease
MGDTADDPVDHARTFLPHAGEAMKNKAGRPALILILVGIFAVFISLASFGIGYLALGIVSAVVAAVGFVVGLTGVAVQRKRVLRLERQWHAEHPEDPDARPPAA